MKRFNDYSDQELLALDNETLNDAVRIEAIQRGIEPPMTLPEALRKSEWQGYQHPAEAVTVYEICTQTQYGGIDRSGLAFFDRYLADNALLGGLSLYQEGYGAEAKERIKEGNLCVMERKVGVSLSSQKAAKLEEYQAKHEEFDAVRDECISRLSRVNQEKYDRRVTSTKKAEYLRLAGGDEGIAKGFWNKVERTEWPEEVVAAE